MIKNSVMVGTVAVGPAEWSYVKSLVSLEAPGSKTFHLVRGKQGIADGHNRLIRDFLDSENEWLLSMDADAILHPKTLIRLLSWDKKFVSAVAVGRIAPFQPVIYNNENEDGTFMREIGMTRSWVREHPSLLQVSTPVVLLPRPNDALFEIERSGAHCLLTHREVFEAIDEPWFMRSGARANEGRGSDFYFTKMVREAGYDTYIDRSVVAGHIVHGHVANLLDFAVWDTCINYDSGNIEIPLRGDKDDTDN